MIINDLIKRLFKTGNHERMNLADMSMMVAPVAGDTESAVPAIARDTSTATNPYAGFCVCLDPGHARNTKGKRSPYSMHDILPALPLEEWSFNRDITALLARRMTDAGFSVFITTDQERDGNADISLTERARRANAFVRSSGKRGIFISIHADADGNGAAWTSASGWSAYTTRGQNNSDMLAEHLYSAAEEILTPLGKRIRRDTTDGDSDKEKDFTVIVKADMPAVLTENFFYTNVTDTEFISGDEGKRIITDVLERGIVSFVNDKYLKENQ